MPFLFTSPRPSRFSLPQFSRAGFYLLVFFIGLAVLPAAETSRPQVLVNPSTLPTPTPGHPGAFAGLSRNALISAGGADSNNSASVLPLTPGASWLNVPWPEARAWGATAPYADDLICVGGLTPQGYSRAVTRLSWSEGKLVSQPLLDLPQPLAGAGAAVIKDQLYVFGGLTSPQSAEAEKALWVLDLKKAGAQWQALEPLPSTGKVLAAVTAQYQWLQVYGGREASPSPQGVKGFRTSDEVWVYLPTAVEGTMHRGWQRRTALPQPLAGATVAASGQGHTILSGGDPTPWVENPLSLSPSPTAQTVWLYHAVTDAWANSGAQVSATGAQLAHVPNGEWLLFGSPEQTKVFELKTLRITRNLTLPDYLVIAVYFIFIMGIGVYFSRQQESSAEFSLGNRKVVWWAAGISMFATGASAISFMAIPALAFATNLIWVLPLLVYIPAYFIQAHLIFPLLRRMEITSTYEYLDRRFNRALRLIASLQCIVLQTFGRASVVLVLPSLAISATTGLNVYLSVIIMGVLTTIYTSVGGFAAVIWTEVFQGILKFIAPIIMIGVAIASLPGGVSEFFSIGQSQEKLTLYLPTWDPTYPALWVLLLATLVNATIYQAGDQPIIQRVFSSPMKEVRRVAAMSAACSVLIGCIVNFMGIAIFCYFRAHPEKFDALAQNDQIVPLFTIQAMPPGMAGMVIAAIFASAMATVASSMNSVATIFTEDFYLRWRPQASDHDRLRVLKITSYTVGFIGTGIALILASQNLKSIMVVWSQVVALLGGGIVGVYSLGMFTRRANGVGAVTGAIASMFLMIAIKAFTPLHWMTFISIAIFSCMGIGYVTSLFFGEQKKDLTGLTIYTPTPNPRGS